MSEDIRYMMNKRPVRQFLFINIFFLGWNIKEVFGNFLTLLIGYLFGEFDLLGIKLKTKRIMIKYFR